MPLVPQGTARAAWQTRDGAAGLHRLPRRRPPTDDLQQAHVWPRFPDAWGTSGNPVRSYTLLNHESPEFIRFVNPGDLRIAPPELRQLPRRPGPSGQEEHDDPWRDALGLGALQ